MIFQRLRVLESFKRLISTDPTDPKTLFQDLVKSSNRPRRTHLGVLQSLGQEFQLPDQVPKYHTVHIQSTRNNTIATLTNHSGQIIATSSAGSCGLRNAAQGTSDAGYLTVLELVKKVKSKNVFPTEGLHVKLKGFGPGREQAFRAVIASGWDLKRITDVTPYRHAGCRPPKKRRL